jgi:hypothetical protein
MFTDEKFFSLAAHSRFHLAGSSRQSVNPIADHSDTMSEVVLVNFNVKDANPELEAASRNKTTT